MATKTPAALTARRLALLANGYEPIPLAGEAPRLSGWPTHRDH